MGIVNSVQLIGYCAQKPELCQTKRGLPMAILVVYTHEKNREGISINQPHRCVFFGNQVVLIADIADTGRHIHVRGAIRSQAVGEGKARRYYTSIWVGELYESAQPIAAITRDLFQDL